jgi:hypothetical protein
MKRENVDLNNGTIQLEGNDTKIKIVTICSAICQYREVANGIYGRNFFISKWTWIIAYNLDV